MIINNKKKISLYNNIKNVESFKKNPWLCRQT